MGEDVKTSVKSPENVLRAARNLPSAMICSRTIRSSLKAAHYQDPLPLVTAAEVGLAPNIVDYRR
jgi:hypothetical protein